MKKFLTLVLALALLTAVSFASAENTPSLHLNVLGRQRSGITFEDVTKLNAWEYLCNMFAENDLALDYTVVERDQYAAILNATLSGGEIPDFFYAASLSDADCVNLIENGMMLNIKDVLQYSKGPAAKEYAEGGLYHINAQVFSYTDGGMYFFGNVSKQISVENDYFGPQAIEGNNCAMLIRQDWLDKLNLPMPTTLDEVFSTLVAFQENDMNGNGIKDERMCINISGTGGSANNAGITDYMFNGVAQWFGLAPFNYQLNRATGEAMVPINQPGYKAYINFLQKCVDAGVIYLTDSVSYYNGGTSEGDNLSVHMQDNVVGMYFGVALADHAFQPAEAVYTVMPVIKGCNEADPIMTVSSGYKTWSRWGFSSKANPKAVAAFLDTICTQDYAKWVTFGIEGETYYIDADSGNYVFTASNKYDDIAATGLARGYMLVIDSFLPDASQIGWYNQYYGPLNWKDYDEFLASRYFNETMANKYTEKQISNMKLWCENAKNTVLVNFNNDIGMITPMLTTDESEIVDMYNTDLETRMAELTVGFLTGLFDINKLDSYIDELNGMGLEDLAAVRQAQYNRYYQK